MTYKRIAFASILALAGLSGQVVAATGDEEYGDIPFLSDLSAAGFNVHMRKSEDAPAAPQAPMETIASDIAKNEPAKVPALSSLGVQDRVRLETASHDEIRLGLTEDGFMTRNGVKSFYLKPGPVKVSWASKRAMKSVECAREDANKMDMGYIVYSRDAQALGYLSDFKLGKGSTFDTFRVTTFPEVFGKSVCLEFDGTNPYPNDRVGNQPKVKLTIGEIKANLPL